MVLLLGCAGPRVVAAPRIPREQPLWVAEPTGADPLVNDALASRLAERLARHGATLRHDAAWVVSVQVEQVSRCREGPACPDYAHGLARAALSHGGAIAVRFEVRASTPCTYVSGADSATALAALFAESIARFVESRRVAITTSRTPSAAPAGSPSPTR